MLAQSQNNKAMKSARPPVETVAKIHCVLFFLSLLAGSFLGLIFGFFDLGADYSPRYRVDLNFGDVLCTGLGDIERPNQLSMFSLDLFTLNGAVRNLGKGRLFGVSF